MQRLQMTRITDVSADSIYPAVVLQSADNTQETLLWGQTCRFIDAGMAVHVPPACAEWPVSYAYGSMLAIWQYAC